MCLVCFLSHHCLPMSHGTKKPKKSASRERTCIVLPFHVFPIVPPPSSWIRSRNLRPTSLDIGEPHDASGRCIGSIAFSSERQFPRDCRCGIIGTVNNILPVRCLGNHIDLNCVPNDPTREKVLYKESIHQHLILCAKIAVARGDVWFNSTSPPLNIAEI